MNLYFIGFCIWTLAIICLLWINTKYGFWVNSRGFLRNMGNLVLWVFAFSVLLWLFVVNFIGNEYVGSIWQKYTYTTKYYVISALYDEGQKTLPSPTKNIAIIHKWMSYDSSEYPMPRYSVEKIILDNNQEVVFNNCNLIKVGGIYQGRGAPGENGFLERGFCYDSKDRIWMVKLAEKY